MKIELQTAGKKYFREWIFRKVNLHLESPEKVAILGPNGSGKSTFLQMLSGSLLPTEGKVLYSHAGNEINPENIFRHVSISAPSIELIEEFTLDEIIAFHFSFKKTVSNLSFDEIISITELGTSRNKIFKYFSSGMKQRVKLALAILSEVELVLLDEPCSNLDASAIQWYKELVSSYAEKKLIVVCSNNQLHEYEFCTRKLNVMEWK